MKQQHHVAIFAFPFGTHAPPLLSMALKLAASAPNIAFSFFTTAKSNASLAQKFPSSSYLENLRFYNVSEGIPENYALTGKQEEEIELFMKATPENFEKSLKEAVEKMGGAKVTCLMSDSFFWFAGHMAAEKMNGIPWIAFWTSGACSLLVHFHTDLIRSKIDAGLVSEPGWEDQELGFVPGLSDTPIRVQDLPEGIVFGELESIFSRLLHQMGEKMPGAAAVLINTFEKLELTIFNNLSSELQKCLAVGPLTLSAPQLLSSDEDRCLPWLDSHDPATVAYVCFGTVAPLPKAELESLAEGLEASGVPFVWSLKEEESRKKLQQLGFLDRTKDRGLVVSWAPQSQILEHPAVGAFVTHCGWNSVLESITGGVPTICRPFFGDQRLNGRLISDVWGIGVGVEGGELTREGVLTALDVVLRRDEGREMRSKVGALREQARLAARPDGSSTENFDQLLRLVLGAQPSN